MIKGLITKSGVETVTSFYSYPKQSLNFLSHGGRDQHAETKEKKKRGRKEKRREKKNEKG